MLALNAPILIFCPDIAAIFGLKGFVMKISAVKRGKRVVLTKLNLRTLVIHTKLQTII